MREFGEWRYDCNEAATRLAYAKAEFGGAASCECNGCRNFVLARPQAFPAQFVAFLESVGVDPSKDGEVYHNARLKPGRHDYGGWFHFIGELYETGDFPAVDFGGGFTASMCRTCAPALSTLKNLETVQVEFHADAVPWMLDEPEAE